MKKALTIILTAIVSLAIGISTVHHWEVRLDDSRTIRYGFIQNEEGNYKPFIGIEIKF